MLSHSCTDQVGHLMTPSQIDPCLLLRSQNVTQARQRHASLNAPTTHGFYKTLYRDLPFEWGFLIVPQDTLLSSDAPTGRSQSGPKCMGRVHIGSHKDIQVAAETDHSPDAHAFRRAQTGNHVLVSLTLTP